MKRFGIDLTINNSKNMPIPYSYDLRKRVIEFIESGETAIKASKVFNISRKVIYDWKKLKKETGDIKHKTGFQKGHSHKITDMKKFKEFLNEHYDKTSAELAKLWPRAVSKNTILRAIRKIDSTYKKNLLSPQKRCWVKRQVYQGNKAY